MKPFKLIPAFKSYLWGGEKLKTQFNKKTDVFPLAESWELSCHKSGLSRLESNPEITLEEYINNSDADVLGKAATKFEKFPIILKLIDAKDNLSIQVHPDDEYALKNENQYGKAEAWYVLHADEGAKIIYGLKKEVSRKELSEHIKSNTLMEILRVVEVKSGDLFYIEPGTLHAIGKGIVIAEIQQNSDITYRVYDYNRKDSYGNTRPLHLDKACDVIKYKREKIIIDKETEDNKDFSYERLIDCYYFKFNKLIVKSEFNYTITMETFVTLLCIDGSAEIFIDGECLKVNKGDCYFCPAGEYSFKIIGKCEILECSL